MASELQANQQPKLEGYEHYCHLARVQYIYSIHLSDKTFFLPLHASIKTFCIDHLDMGQATKTWKEEMAEDNARREAERAKRKQEGLEIACYGYVSAVTHDSLP